MTTKEDVCIPQTVANDLILRIFYSTFTLALSVTRSDTTRIFVFYRTWDQRSTGTSAGPSRGFWVQLIQKKIHLNFGEILHTVTRNEGSNKIFGRRRVCEKLRFNGCDLLNLQMGTSGGPSRPDTHRDDDDLENLLDGE